MLQDFVGMNKFCASDRLYHALVVLAGIEIIGREKLVNGEGYAAEHRARIILGRALRTPSRAGSSRMPG